MLRAQFCVDALNETSHKFGPPEIINMEHGRAIGPSGHATSRKPVHVLYLDGSAASIWRADLDGWDSMDGNRRFLDNIFVERLWRNLNRRTA